MNFSVSTVTRDFSPREVARVSGVSTSLQRDWRRRGVIPSRAEGWNKYSLDDVIRMTVMRAFTQSGISLETAEIVSQLAVLPVIDELVRWDDVAQFDGDPLSEKQMNMIRESHVSGASGDEQFTFVALPDDGEGSSAARLRNLADAEAVMGRSRNFYGIALDHTALAHRIARLSPTPIITFNIQVKRDG